MPHTLADAKEVVKHQPPLSKQHGLINGSASFLWVMEEVTATKENGAIVGQRAAPVADAPIKFCLYARKSTESEERQVRSIESQIKEMLEIANRDGLQVAGIKQESHSAKASGTRKVFRELLLEIESGTYDGIITWAPDRLSRNGGDLGMLVDLMDRELLREIRTHGQTFTNNPNEKFLLMILGSQAKLENDHRGQNVKRGMRARAESGGWMGVAPFGYINIKSPERGKGKIVHDPIRAPIVKRIFEGLAYESFSGREMFRQLFREGMRTRQGGQIHPSMIYKILQNPMYYGEFEYPAKSGNWYKGRWKPIVTKELYQKAQSNIKAHSVTEYGSRDFTLNKLIRCGACGSGISGTAKRKFIKSKNEYAEWYYYRCTKGTGMRQCSESQVSEPKLLKQLAKILDEVSLDAIGARERFADEVNRYNQFRTTVLGEQSEDIEQLEDQQIRNYAKYVLRNGGKEQQREILELLKSKLYLKDKKLYTSV